MRRVALFIVLCGCDLVYGLERSPDPCASYTRDPQTGAAHRFVGSRTTWRGASVACALDIDSTTVASHLVVIGSDDERSAVHDLTSGSEIWIGLSSLRENLVFRWVTAEDVVDYPATPMQPPWDPAQPNNFDPSCVSMDEPPTIAGEWFDRNCNLETAFVCECDEFPDDPAQYTPP